MNFESIKGMTFTSVFKGEKHGDDAIYFESEDGRRFAMYHDQDCCEHVYIESIVGDLTDLVGTPILTAEEASNDDPNASESGTWTFYKLATIKGYVDIRWYGSSNGYYGESAGFYEVTK